MTTEEFEPGVGCRVALQIFGLFVAMLTVAAVVFFTGDPTSVEPWRVVAISIGAPVSGVVMAAGAQGMAWTLDLLLWLGLSVWIARPDEPALMRRRVILVLVLAVLVGTFAASAA